MNEKKIAIHGISNREEAHYKVTSVNVRPHSASDQGRGCHHIIFVDRATLTDEAVSNAKHLLVKLFTLEEYRDAESLISLISLNDKAQPTVHFERTSLAQVMREGSRELAATLELAATHSSHQLDLKGAFQSVRDLIREDEVNLITLHTISSPEWSAINPEELFIGGEDLSQSALCALNVISYNADSASHLERLASRFGGRCVRADQLRQVYDAIYQSSDALLSQSRWVTHISGGSNDGWLLSSPTLERPLIGVGDAQLHTLREGEVGRLYLFEEIDEVTFHQLDLPEIQPTSRRGYLSLIALSRFCLERHRHNHAKLSLISARSEQLTRRHMRALTAPELTALKRDLDERLISDRGRRGDPMLTPKRSLSAPSVFEVLMLLHKHRREVKISRDHLNTHYQRCTLPRLKGSWGEDAELIPPHVDVHATNDRGYLSLSAVEIGERQASLNLITSERVTMISESGEEIRQIQGVELDELNRYRSYSVVEDGALHLSKLRVRLESKALFAQLSRWGLLRGDYNPTVYQELDLSELPLITEEPSVIQDPSLFTSLAQLRLLKSFLNATLGAYSDRFTETQITALREHHLTAQLNLNIPMAPLYPDLKAAHRAGLINVKTRRVIELGDQIFSGLNQLPSAHALLRSTYLLTHKDEVIQRPTLDQLNTEVQVHVKPRIRDTDARRILRPLFDELLGLSAPLEGEVSVLDGLLEQLSLDGEVKDRARRALQGRLRDEMSLEALDTLRHSVEESLKARSAERVAPLTFYVGVTGLIPQAYRARVYIPATQPDALPSMRRCRDLEMSSVFTLGEALTLSARPEEVWVPSEQGELQSHDFAQRSALCAEKLA